MYRKITYVRKCDGNSGITLLSMDDTIRNIEFLKRSFDRDVIKCLEYCREKLRGHHPPEVWRNAEVTVEGRFTEVFLVAGDGLSRFGVRLDKDGDPTHTETVWPSHLPPPSTEHSSWRRSPEVGRECIAQVECKPTVTFKHIKDALAERTFRLNIFSLKDDMKTCLQYCFGLLKDKEQLVWENARITIHGINLTFIFTSGSETHQFDVMLDRQSSPTHLECQKKADKDVIEKEYSPKITCGEISKEIQRFREDGTIWLAEDFSLLRHCFKLIEENQNAIWENAEIAIFCSETKVCFYSGSKKSKFEIVLGPGNKPICTKTDCPSVNTDISRTKIEKKCDPLIKLEHVYSVITEMESNHGELHEFKVCIRECMNVVRNQSDEVLKNARIKLYCKEGLITLEAGSCMNNFEIVYDVTGVALTNEYIDEMCTDSGMSNLQDPIIKECLQRIDFGEVAKLLQELQQRGVIWREHDTELLKSCFRLLEEYPNDIWYDAEIKVFCRRTKVLIQSGKRRFKFHVVLGPGNMPMWKLTDFPDFQKDVSDQNARKEREFKKKCDPFINVAHVYDVEQEIEHVLGEMKRCDYECINQCKIIILEHTFQDLSNARIRIYCKLVLITLESGSGFNRFDIINCGSGKVLTKVYTSDDVDDTLKSPDIEIINCGKSITEQHVKEKIRKLGRSCDDKLRKCLQHCNTLIRDEKKKIGTAVWTDAEITVTSDGRPVRFRAGNAGNKYNVFIGENGHPTYTCEAQNMRKRFWDGLDWVWSSGGEVLSRVSAAVAHASPIAGALTAGALSLIPNASKGNVDSTSSTPKAIKEEADDTNTNHGVTEFIHSSTTVSKSFTKFSKGGGH